MSKPSILIWDDPSKPREVRWLCFAHRDERAATARNLEASRAALQDHFAAVATAIGGLPPEVVAQLYATDLEGLGRRGDAPGTIWCWWALRREHTRRLDEQCWFV